MNEQSNIRVSCIDHVKMDVLDMVQTKQFYCEVFGFKVYDDDSNISIVGNEHIKLCLYHAKKINHGSIEHFGFHVVDFDRTLALFDGKRIRYILSYWEYSRSAYILDPNGYRIELSEMKGGGHDLSDEEKQQREIEIEKIQESGEDIMKGTSEFADVLSYF